ncbi:putative multidrug resistance-associated protein lethal [Pseudolycoriella hygida]|uniref:Multidrug resistance-associated protein lethal n=1 Tax=Pseudolycoriella hygida TaxID=35572 RepID=A0A9Q0MSH6_9DIPT|nr:putative multidrug resistance-associated protein lethal [Pseudolycoriella hygida]
MNLAGANSNERPDNPVEEASFISKCSFWWLKDLFKLGLSRPIEEGDIYKTLKVHESKKLSENFAALWIEEQKKQKPSLFRVMRKMYAKKILGIGMFFTFVDSLSRVIQPQCLGGLVTYFTPSESELISRNDAYLYAAGIVLCSLISITVFHPFILYAFQLGMRIRLTCCSLIYKKALKLTKSVSIDGLNGQVINLMSNDVARFDVTMGFVHDLWKGPIELGLLGYFIYREIGFYGWIGIGVLLCFIPLQTWIGKRAATYRLKTAKRTDRRVRIMNEIIQGIQVIKMYTWEKSFAKIVDQIRKKEISGIRGTLFIRGTLLSFNIVSRFSIFISLVAFVYFGNMITARKVFIITSYFNFLYSSVLHFWPLAVSSMAEVYVSIKRVQDFLLLPEDKDTMSKHFEHDDNNEFERLLKVKFGNDKLANVNHIENMKNVRIMNGHGNACRRIVVESSNIKGITFVNATAQWLRQSSESNTGIENVTLDIRPSNLCSIVGVVGSGKSTLLQVILGELELDEGSLLVNGSISYAPQEPWLFEGTIRQNIIFISDYNEKRYKEVIKVCALERDLELFPHGDATIVGERGVSLSGGQRARVNLARAIYRTADIYLLDDPLSAVDTHVGKQIFEKCILEFLKDKVCVLVTHQLQYLKDVRHAVLMNMGRIEAQGTYNDLKQSRKHSLLWLGSEEDKEGNDENLADEIVEKNVKINPQEQDDNKETLIIGSVGFRVYKSYFKSVNSVILLILVAALFICGQTAISNVDLYVSKWVNWEDQLRSNHQNQSVNSRNFAFNTSTIDVRSQDNVSMSITENMDLIWDERHEYIYYYSFSMLIVLYLVFQRSFAFFQMCLKASRNLHDKLFRGITRATMYFFNTNPSGRILNRFSKDIGSIDTTLPVALMDCLLFFLELFAIIILVLLVNYWLLLPTFIMSILFYALRHVYVNTARCIKRVEALTRSPIFSHANATLQGLSTIRAFKAQQILSNEFDSHQDLNTSSWYLFLASTRAFALWLELVCVLYMATVILSFLLLGNDTLGGNVGLAITQIFNLIIMCQWGMRQTAELENQMTSVERVIEYADLKSEPPLESLEKYRPPENWPERGIIQFNGLSMKYSENSNNVLNEITIRIESTEKIGVVGRTGAGKSSIIQALFRLALNDGVITIDGVDTASMGLHDLRSKISIIPQDPILFSGNMRNNLDPFEDKTDDEIWNALAQVELKQVVSLLPGGLNCKMSDGGSNFSMGQRQLVCLARAILRNNKILVLDEATSNVDAETDNFIQKTIRTKFSDCTVITIAHRLHTVMDSDRVLVMDAGKVVEYAHPFDLLKSSNGYLRKLVDQTGNATALHLMQMAEQSYKKLTEL